MANIYHQQHGSISWRRTLLLSSIVLALAAAAISLPLFGYQSSTRHAPRSSGESELQALIAERGWSFAMREDAEANLRAVPYDEIAFERGPCFGPCPVYRMVIYKDGKATLVRDHGVSSSVSYVGEITALYFARIAQLAALAHEDGRVQAYSGQWTDDYEVRIFAKGSKGDLEVRDYGQVGPPVVWALQRFLG